MGRCCAGHTPLHAVNVPSTDSGSVPWSYVSAGRHRITLCTSPVSRPLHAERVRQWMHYHANVHGVDFYTFYDAGGMDYDMGQVGLKHQAVKLHL